MQASFYGIWYSIDFDAEFREYSSLWWNACKNVNKHKWTILEYKHRSSFKVMVTTTVSRSLRSTIRLFDLIIMSQIDRSSKRAVQLSLCTAHAYNVRKKPVLDATAEARYIYFMSSCRTIFTAFTIYDWWQIIWIRFFGIAFELH